MLVLVPWSTSPIRPLIVTDLVLIAALQLILRLGIYSLIVFTMVVLIVNLVAVFFVIKYLWYSILNMLIRRGATVQLKYLYRTKFVLLRIGRIYLEYHNIEEPSFTEEGNSVLLISDKILVLNTQVFNKEGVS